MILTGLLMSAFIQPNAAQYSMLNEDYVKHKRAAIEFTATLTGDYKCNYPLSAISYAFALKETSNGKAGVGRPSDYDGNQLNNLFSMKGSGPRFKAQGDVYIWDKNKKKMVVSNYTQSGYRRYKKAEDSIYDFMYLFYNKYHCVLSKDSIHTYKNGPRGGWEGVDLYYNQVLKSVNKYMQMKELFEVRT